LRLECDFWVRNTVATNSTADPSWSDVESAIRALDAQFRTEIDRETEDGGFGVGGGDGRYVVIWTPYEVDDPWTLLAGVPGEDPVDLVVGGQMGRFRPDSVVGLDEALQAARVFFDSQELPDSLGWRRDFEARREKP